MCISSYIFWTDWGDNGGIEKSNMDGSERRKIAGNRQNAWPNGLTADTKGERQCLK